MNNENVASGRELQLNTFCRVYCTVVKRCSSFNMVKQTSANEPQQHYWHLTRVCTMRQLEVSQCTTRPWMRCHPLASCQVASAQQFAGTDLYSILWVDIEMSTSTVQEHKTKRRNGLSVI